MKFHILLLLSMITSFAKSQTKWLNGMVKELHAGQNHKSKPLSYVNLTLIINGEEVGYQISKDSGLFSFSKAGEIKNAKLKVEYENWEIIDDDPLNNLNWTSNSKTLTTFILMCDKNKVNQISENYYRQVQKQIARNFENELKRITIKYEVLVTSLRDSMNKFQESRNVDNENNNKKWQDSVLIQIKNIKDSLIILRNRYDFDLAKAKAFADDFAKCEFTEEYDILYKCFLFFIKNQLDSCEYYYDKDNYLERATEKEVRRTKLLINAWLINAQSKERENKKNEAKYCYKTAIDISPPRFNYITYEAYSNFLLSNNEVEEARRVILKKLAVIDWNSQPLENLLYTYYQLMNNYKDVDSSKFYALKILNKRSEILSTINDYKSYSILMSAYDKLSNDASKSRETIYYEKQLLKLYDRYDWNKIDSFGVKVPTKVEILTDIGRMYDDGIFSKNKSFYFLKLAAAAARENYLNDTSKENFNSLKLTYDLFRDVYVSKRKVVSYLQEQIKLNNLAIRNFASKSELDQYLIEVIERRKEWNRKFLTFHHYVAFYYPRL